MNRPQVDSTSDRETVLAAVANDGEALGYASEALRSDRALVLTAVSNKGIALKFASKALRSDREVVLTAVAEHGARSTTPPRRCKATARSC